MTMLNKAMSQGRRFVNILSVKGGRGAFLYSLGREPQERLFYPSTQEALKGAQKGETWMEERISRLPTPRIKFQSPKKVDFLPFYGPGSNTESKILCADEEGGVVLYDADSGLVETMPSLKDSKGAGQSHRPMRPPCRCPGSLPRRHPNSDRYAWHWVELSPPPYVHDDAYVNTLIESHALLPAGIICVSAASLGTYCFDTASREWTKAGCWKLPFHGRAQHVPELNNLCFGIAASSPFNLCAVDLSSIHNARVRKAPVEYSWPDLSPPNCWKLADVSMVYLGAGRFCIAKVFEIVGDDTDDVIDMATVLTGVEMVEGGGPSKLEMIKHKTRYYGFTREDHGTRCVL